MRPPAVAPERALASLLLPRTHARTHVARDSRPPSRLSARLRSSDSVPTLREVTDFFQRVADGVFPLSDFAAFQLRVAAIQQARQEVSSGWARRVDNAHRSLQKAPANALRDKLKNEKEQEMARAHK